MNTFQLDGKVCCVESLDVPFAIDLDVLFIFQTVKVYFEILIWIECFAGGNSSIVILVYLHIFALFGNFGILDA